MFVVLAFALDEFLVDPLALVLAGGAAENAFEFPIRAGFELPDFVLALDHQRQRRRLHAADRRQVEAAGFRVESGHRARAVDADQPVGFRTADRGVGQSLHLGAGPQLGKAFFDRLLRHRLQPQPLDRLAGFGVLHDVVEDQLAFASRVAGIDQRSDILALD